MQVSHICTYEVRTLLTRQAVHGIKCDHHYHFGKYGSTSYIGMTPPKMAANRNSRTDNTKTCMQQHTHQVFISSYAQNTLQRLANLRPEGERDGPKLLECSPEFFTIFLFHCNSQTTQATELTHTRIQIAPSMLITFHIKEDARPVRLKFPGTSTLLIQHSP